MRLHDTGSFAPQPAIRQFLTIGSSRRVTRFLSQDSGEWSVWLFHQGARNAWKMICVDPRIPSRRGGSVSSVVRAIHQRRHPCPSFERGREILA